MKTFSLQYTVINDKYLEVLDSIQPWCGFLKQGGDTDQIARAPGSSFFTYIT